MKTLGGRVQVHMYMYVDLLLFSVDILCSQFHIHSKNYRVRFDPEKSPRGPDPFWGQTYPESRSDWPGIRVRLTRNPSQKDILDSDSGNFYPDSRSVWPQNGSGPLGLFSGSNLTWEFLECRIWIHKHTKYNTKNNNNQIYLSGLMRYIPPELLTQFIKQCVSFILSGFQSVYPTLLVYLSQDSLDSISFN